jgi:hypothetical protein
MKGDTAAANAIFQKHLDGELPEELTLLSRRHVQENQNQSVGDGKRRGPGSRQWKGPQGPLDDLYEYIC